jgi:uncharacterized protein (TIGR02231 family)
MKSALLILLIGFSGITHHSFAQQREKRVNSRPTEVTIFLRGAQIRNEANISINPGISEIVFENMPLNLDESTFSASSESDITILSVSYRTNYMNEKEQNPEVKKLQDSLRSMNDRKTIYTGQISILQKEEDFLNSNKSIGGQNTGFTAAELEKTADFIRRRYTDINNQRLAINQKIKRLDESIQNVNAQLGELNAGKKAKGEIVVNVSADKPVSGKLAVDYFMADASWTPYYDIRATEPGKPVKLEYRAKVRQNSGYDWKNVKLTLSSNNPSLRGNKPNLGIWNIDFNQPLSQYRLENNAYLGQAPMAAWDEQKNTRDVKEKIQSKTTADFTVMTENATSVIFDIKIPYDIPADNKDYVVSIQNFELPATYEYYAAPKLDRDAFLLAKVSGWEKFNLISGNTNIFFEGMYVGQSYLDTRYTKDTLDISLGRDKGIAITRSKLKDFTQRKVIGSTMKETYTYEVNLRNKKSREIEIQVVENIPLSQNSEITVELLESAGAEFNKEEGKLIWNLKMKAGENKSLRFSFSVKYPKDRSINGDF